MDLLHQAREIINEVDSQMAQLFQRRMEASEMAARYKLEKGMPILDAQREALVIRNGAARVADEGLRGYYVDFMRETMAISRRYQQRLLERMKDQDEGCTVLDRDGSHPIIIRRGALAGADKYMDLQRKALIVTDSGVPQAYAQAVAACCQSPLVVTIDQGESSKNMENFQLLCKKMLQAGFTSTDCVVAVGGGVVGDLAGFAAASFMRGIDFYNIPTTVLSQVDSSIGGKVAIDMDGIKNCIGAFHQPKAVLVDPEVLSTLPPRQIANGLAEVVKMAATFDESLLSLFETEDPLAHIDDIIIQSLKIKAFVVQADEREVGLRRVLNFGHTIGHGIESAVGLDRLCHGECVALGMLPMCSPALRSRLETILKKLDLPTTCDADPEAVWEAIAHDKKLSGSHITVIYAPEAGSFELRTMPLEALKETVFEFLGAKE